MSTDNRSVLDERVYEIAEEYKQRGYKVTIAPPSKTLPAFLNKFRPDIVAVGPNESVVIEVKSSRKERWADYWRELTNTIHQHPGWRFELIIDNTTKRESPENIKPEQIRELLQEGQRLAKEDMLRASLLVTWSAMEAAMRLASKAYEVDLPDFRPATVISRLYTDGVLEREEYDFLMDCMKIRDSVAHGFQEKSIQPGFTEKLSQIALNLLEGNSNS